MNTKSFSGKPREAVSLFLHFIWFWFAVHMMSMDLDAYDIYEVDLSASVESRWVLGCEQHETRMSFDRFLRFRDEKFSIVVQKLKKRKVSSVGKCQTQRFWRHRSTWLYSLCKRFGGIRLLPKRTIITSLKVNNHDESLIHTLWSINNNKAYNLCL